MSSKFIVAIAAVLFAVVLAAPVAAQTTTAPCGGGSAAAWWRFYTGSDAEVYDFEVQSNHPRAKVVFGVNQYVGRRWETMLSTVGGEEDSLHGSTWLHPRSWTDVVVECTGNVRREVALSVTRRAEVRLRRLSYEGCDNTPSGGSSRWHFPLPYDNEYYAFQYDFEARGTNRRSWVNLTVDQTTDNGPYLVLQTASNRGSGLHWVARGSAWLRQWYVSGSRADVYLSCGGGEGDVALRVTRREHVRLRRR